MENLKIQTIIISNDCGNNSIKLNQTSTFVSINYSNNQLLCYIRGNLILPKYGDKTFSRNIGALKLFKEQNKYFKQYFLSLGTQWEYMPEEKHLKLMRDFFMKYYGEKYVIIFDEAVANNKIHLNKY